MDGTVPHLDLGLQHPIRYLVSLDKIRFAESDIIRCFTNKAPDNRSQFIKRLTPHARESVYNNSLLHKFTGKGQQYIHTLTTDGAINLLRILPNINSYECCKTFLQAMQAFFPENDEIQSKKLDVNSFHKKYPAAKSDISLEEIQQLKNEIDAKTRKIQKLLQTLEKIEGLVEDSLA